MSSFRIDHVFLLFFAVLLAFSAPVLADDVIGGSCTDVGVSLMTANKQDVIICLNNANSQPVWKRMSGAPVITYSNDIASSGSGTTLPLGKHSLCALTRSYLIWASQAGGCNVYADNSGDYFLNANGDPGVESGQGIVCRAVCLDY